MKRSNGIVIGTVIVILVAILILVQSQFTDRSSFLTDPDAAHDADEPGPPTATRPGVLGPTAPNGPPGGTGTPTVEELQRQGKAPAGNSGPRLPSPTPMPGG